MSLILAVVFWRLATLQAQTAQVTLNETQSTLNEIKDKILSWQNDMNKAAINLIEARPEVIAQKVSLEEAKSSSDFVARIAGQVESLLSELNPDSAGYKLAAIKELLDHQRNLVLGSEQIKANLIAQSKAPPPAALQ